MDLVIAAIDGLKELINTKINMPLLSALFDLIGGGDLTVLNLTGMLVAIPGTILSKLLFGEPPFKNVSQPEFPAPVATSVLGGFSLQAGEPDIDVDNQRRKVIAFGVIGITADLLNGILSTGLDLVPEPLEFMQRDTTHLEVMSLVLSGVSWLASFPASRVEAGGYPYPLALDKNKVSKQNDEQEYWERVMWGWRTFVLSFDIVYMAVAAAATRVNPENKVVKALFQVQRLTRGTEITAALTTAFTLVDVGLTGRYLATIPKEDKVGREITNELMGFLPTAFCWMRMTLNPLLWLGLFGINVTSTFVTTGLNIAILKDDVRELL